MKIEIKNKNDLVKITEYMHDTAFENNSLGFQRDSKKFHIKSKEYEYKGKFFQKKTERIIAECELILCDVKAYEQKFINKKAEDGYKAIEEDYFNEIEIKNNSVFIKTLFQKIIIEVDNFNGEFKKLEKIDEYIVNIS